VYWGPRWAAREGAGGRDEDDVERAQVGQDLQPRETTTAHGGWPETSAGRSHSGREWISGGATSQIRTTTAAMHRRVRSMPTAPAYRLSSHRRRARATRSAGIMYTASTAMRVLIFDEPARRSRNTMGSSVTRPPTPSVR
jgi:hypothetical protein